MVRVVVSQLEVMLTCNRSRTVLAWLRTAHPDRMAATLGYNHYVIVSRTDHGSPGLLP